MCNSLRRMPLLWILLVLALWPALTAAHNDKIYNPHPSFTPVPAAEMSRLDLLTEGFEASVPPPGWAMIDAGIGSNWFQTDFLAHSGTYSAVVAYDDPGLFQDEWLVTPMLDFTGMSAIFLEFFEDEDYWASYGLAHYVMVSTTSQTDPASFTPVVTMTPGNHTVNGFGGDPVTVSLAAYANEPVVYVALRYTGDWADNWFIDDVRIYEPFEHDVKAVSAGPNAQFAGGDTLVPEATVTNIGQNTETFDVLMEVNESGTVVYSETVSVNALVVGEERAILFPGMMVSDGNYYALMATTLLGTDMDNSNDSASGMSNTYTQQRVPLGHLNTNAGCGPCAQANQALDAYLPGQGNMVACERLHVWWPSPSDQMWLDNEEQNEWLAEAYGADYAPHFWVDGVVDVGSSGTSFAPAMEARKAYRSPMLMALGWNAVTQELTVEVQVVDNIPPADYTLRVAITEDNIYFVGGNGENIHNQAFRYMYPDTDGMVVPAAPGTYTYVVHTPLDLPYWNYDELRATCYVHDEARWEVMQAVTHFLHENPIANYLRDFTVASASGGIDIEWAVNGTPNPAELQLRARNSTAEWDVPFTVSAGSFQARDESPNLTSGGEVTYSLYRQGELIGSQTVTIEIPVVMTRLDGAAPNPFNPKTTVSFSVGHAQPVRIAVYDLAGRLVAELANEVYGPGSHTVDWDGKDMRGMAVSSGTYFARMEAKGVLETTKLMLVQ